MVIIKYILQIVFAAIGSFGFSMVFNVHGKKMLAATIGGGLCWTSFIVLTLNGFDDYNSAMITSMIIVIYAELMAKRTKTPMTVFSLIGIIPIIPGAGLYKTMDALLSKNYQLFCANGVYTILFAVYMAIGIAIATLCIRMLENFCTIKFFKGQNNHAEK